LLIEPLRDGSRFLACYTATCTAEIVWILPAHKPSLPWGIHIMNASEGDVAIKNDTVTLDDDRDIVTIPSAAPEMA
jgi:hypothetical protein